MLKKLTEEKREEILEAGIEAFAESGLHGAGMADIARRAGISVGVLYKYYVNKEDFFHACLRHSLASLEDVLRQVTGREDKLLGYAGQIIRALQDFSRDHGSHIRMYHQITTASGRQPGGWQRRSRGSPSGSTPTTSPGPRPGGSCAGTWTPGFSPSSSTIC